MDLVTVSLNRATKLGIGCVEESNAKVRRLRDSLSSREGERCLKF